MIEPGLTEDELGRLRLAGFSGALVEAISAEARTMRFLWVRRAGFGFQTAIFALVGATVAGGILGLPEPLQSLVQFGLPLLVIIATVLPWYEVMSMKSTSRERWAARELAVLSTRADPGEGNDEWQRLTTLALAAPPMASVAVALQALANALDDQSVAAQMARANAQRGQTDDRSEDRSAAPQPVPPPKDQPHPRPTAPPARKPRRNPAPSRADRAVARSMTPSARDKRNDAIRGAIIAGALIALVVLILLQRQAG